MAKGGKGKAQLPRSGKRNNERRGGQRGNSRGKPDIQLSRRRNREQSPRWRAAREELERERARVEALMSQPTSVGTDSNGASFAVQSVLTPEDALVIKFPDPCGNCGHGEYGHRDGSYRMVKCRAGGCECRQFEELRDEPEPTPEPIRRPIKPKPLKSVANENGVEPDSRGPDEHSIGQARAQMRQGYHISKVIRTTGVGKNWLDDLADADGWGITTEEWLDKQATAEQHRQGLSK